MKIFYWLPPTGCYTAYILLSTQRRQPESSCMCSPNFCPHIPIYILLGTTTNTKINLHTLNICIYRYVVVCIYTVYKRKRLKYIKYIFQAKSCTLHKRNVTRKKNNVGGVLSQENWFWCYFSYSFFFLYNFFKSGVDWSYIMFCLRCTNKPATYTAGIVYEFSSWWVVSLSAHVSQVLRTYMFGRMYCASFVWLFFVCRALCVGPSLSSIIVFFLCDLNGKLKRIIRQICFDEIRVFRFKYILL